IVMVRIDKPGSIWHEHVQKLLSHSNFPRSYRCCIIDQDLISLIPIHEVGAVENCFLSEDYRSLYFFSTVEWFLTPESGRCDGLVTFEMGSVGSSGETGGVDHPTARGLYVEGPIKTND